MAYEYLLPLFGREMPSTLAWIRDSELVVLTQIAQRPDRLGPETVGPVEAEINLLRGRLANRAQTLGNQRRTNLLLRLMVAGRRGQANEQLWAERIRQYLVSRGGQPPHQRPLVEPVGTRTL